MPDLETLRAKLKPLESMSADRARSLLLDETTPALLLYVAALAFYGSTVATYEPETLWSQLDVPLINRDKLLAAMNLQVFPSFYWDIRVFGHTCLAFCDQPAFTELTPKPIPEHVAWGVLEAQLIFQIDTDAEPVFDEEVAAYVAATLAHDGITHVPSVLDFAEEHLTRILSPAGRKISADMKLLVDEPHPKTEPDSVLGVQLARYEQLNAYVGSRWDALNARIRAVIWREGPATSQSP